MKPQRPADGKRSTVVAPACSGPAGVLYSCLIAGVTPSRVDTVYRNPIIDDLTTLALAAARSAPPAELHGTLCGLMSNGRHAEPQEWLQAIFELLGDDAVMDAPALNQLAEATWDALHATSMTFEPALAEEDAPLSERLESLALWCNGYLSGFAVARGQEKPDEQGQELIRDLAAIAQVNFDEDDAGEAGERDYFELCEFVKVATLLLTVMPDEVAS